MKCDYCIGCKHYRSYSGGGHSTDYGCHYNLDMFKSRGCPYGDGCPHHTGRKEAEADG